MRPAKAGVATGVVLAALAGGWVAWAQIGTPTDSAKPAPSPAAAAAPAAPIDADPGRTAPTPPGTAHLAFVINSNEASISLVDVATRHEVRRIPVLREPHHMALTPDHRFLVIGDTTANEMLFLDPTNGTVERRITVSDPYQFGYSPDGKWLVVNGLLRNQIDIFNAATMQLAARVPVSSMPSHLNFSSDSATVYVSLQSSNSLVAIDVRSSKPVWKSVVGPVPAGVLWHRGKLLVGIMGADYVAVVDPATGRMERRVQTAKGAHVLFVPPDGKVIYVTNRVDGSVVVLDPDTLNEIRRFRIPGGPDDMDFAPDGKIWVTRRWAQSVAVVDPLTGSFQTMQTGRSPHGIWLNTHDALSRPESIASDRFSMPKHGA